MRHSIRWRLAIYQVVIVSLAIISVGLAGEQSIRSYYLARLEENLARQACLVRYILRPLLLQELPASQVDAAVKRLSAESRVRVTVVRPDGNVLCDSYYSPGQMPNIACRPEIAALLSGPPHPRLPYTKAVREDGMHVAVPIMIHRQVAAIVRVSLGLRDLSEQLSGLRALFLGVVLLTTCAAIAVTLYCMRAITGPIQEVTTVAQRMADGDLCQRVAWDSPDEIGQLARSFNTMATRIQDMLGELEHERLKMAQVFTQMTDGLLVLDPGMRIRLKNPAAERMLAGFIPTKKTEEAPLPPDLLRLAQQVFQQGTEQHGYLFCDQGGECVLEMCGVPVVERQGVAPGVMLVLRDWTEYWRSERTRRELVANASHELRTPIASLKMMAETLLSGAQDDPEVRPRFIELMANDADRLSRLVASLLDLSQMDAGQWPLDREPMAMAPIIEQMLSKYSITVSERRQHLTGECPRELQVLADKRAVSQILSNLVENAIKYTPEGGKIGVTVAQENGHAVLRVRDTGIGISPEHQANIFERFYRVDKARSRAMGGTGLGLAIVKSLVEALQGTIGVESVLGEGSTFTVTLPLPPSTEA